MDRGLILLKAIGLTLLLFVVIGVLAVINTYVSFTILEVLLVIFVGGFLIYLFGDLIEYGDKEKRGK